MKRVTFKNRNITVVGNLHVPAGFDEGTPAARAAAARSFTTWGGRQRR
jgi:hypothetical protein